ncbi:MAG: hypothetical protein KDB75_10700 [Flavobacteriales bacterium]|nr:hypothetical protein [Flavobacteriales bacterium]
MRQLLYIIALFAGTLVQAQDMLEQEHWPNGKLKHTIYAEGDLVRFVTYFESGRVHEMGAFRHGKRDGAWKQYAEDGTLLARARFLKGVRQGDWHFNQPGQQTTGRLRYKDGRLVEAEQRGPGGSVIARRTYP